jgi:tripartite-type tricarboxylate transporter receptor subunit TctC
MIRHPARPLLLACLVLLGAGGPARADFSLQGRTVTLYVAGGVGGGVDAYARSFVPHLAHYLPGEPAIIVSNMPGAGGIQALQYLYNVAPHDGIAIGTTNAGPVSEPVMGDANVKYDLLKFGWFGSLAKGDTVCAVWSSSPVMTIAEARSREVTISSTGALSAPTRTALLLNALLGTKLKPIPGYDGGTSLLAVERGEVDGTCVTLDSLRATRPDWFRDKKLRLLVQCSLDKDPDFPDVPRAYDLISDETGRRMLEFFLTPYEVQNPFYLAPGYTPEMLAAYRTAFDKAAADPAFRSEAEARGLKIETRTGAEVEAVIKKMLATPEDIQRRTRAVTDPKSAGK